MKRHLFFAILLVTSICKADESLRAQAESKQFVLINDNEKAVTLQIKAVLSDGLRKGVVIKPLTTVVVPGFGVRYIALKKCQALEVEVNYDASSTSCRSDIECYEEAAGVIAYHELRGIEILRDDEEVRWDIENVRKNKLEAHGSLKSNNDINA